MIAWIGADPHLRSVVASHRRATAAPLPPNTRGAKAAVAACFVLAGGAILGITAIVNDGLVAPVASNPSPVLSQDAAATPGPPAARGPGAAIRPNSPAPIATESMTLDRQAQQPIPAPPAGSQSGHVAADDRASNLVGYGGFSVAAPETRPVSPHRADPLPHPDRPVAPIKPTGAGKPSSGNSVGSGNLPSTAGGGDSGKPGDIGKLIVSGAAGGDKGTRDGVATPGVEQSSSPRISTFGQKQTSTHGSISADGPTARMESASGQRSSPKQGSPRR
ncbi:MAG: hypothetical protein ACRDRO_22960 [Pseudonocardiaceae bacterium]